MKIPFAFWGQAESDLPIVAGLKVLSTDLTEVELQFTLVDSGENEPVYAYGIVYSKTDPQVTLDTPGAQVSPIGTNFPGTLPVTNTHTVTGLDNTSTYYFRVFATNNQGQPQEENTFYSNTAIGETVWEAFQFSYNYEYVKQRVTTETPNVDYVNLGHIQSNAIGTQRSFSIQNLTGPNQQIFYDFSLGNQAIKVRVEHPEKTKIYYFTQTNNGTRAINIPISDFPYNTGNFIVSVIHDDTVANSTFNNFRFSDNKSFTNGDHACNAAIRILQWGPSKWKSWEYMFQGDPTGQGNPGNNSAGIGTPIDTADLSECTTWESAFRYNHQAWSGDNPNEQKLADFDLQNIKTIGGCFAGSRVCTYPGAANQDLLKDANWDSCQNFFAAFDLLTLSTNNVMTHIDLSGWEIQSDEVVSMAYMFNFNRSVATRGIGNWDVSKVITMQNMFYYNQAYDEDLSSWDTGEVENMDFMFHQAYTYNQDLSGWDVSSVSRRDFFYDNPDPNVWPVARRPVFPFVFTNSNIGQAITDTLAVDPTGNTAVAPYGAISTWNTSGVTNMDSLFENQAQFNADISNWDVSNVTNMRNMFDDCTAFNQNIGGWDVGNVTRMERMFFRASAFNQDISGWDVGSLNSSGYQQGAFEMFYQTTSFNTSLNGWNLPATLTSLEGMFYGSAYNAPLDQWDVSNITSMSRMFATSSFNQDISSWDTSSVTNMYKMFEFNTVFNQEIGDWDVGSLTNTNQMFKGATAFNKSLANWNAPNLSQIGEMFRQSNFNSPLPNLTLVGDQRGIFYLNSQFNQDISGWDVSGVTLFFYTFRQATSFNQDISDWDVSSAFSFGNMFLGATSFDQNLDGWKPILASSSSGFMQNITLSTANYDALLIAWSAAMEAEYPGGAGYTLTPSWSFGNSVHTTGGAAELAKNNLINTFNWTITDGNP